MKQLMTIISLLRLWMLLVSAALAPSVSFAYDNHHHTTIAYDNGGELAMAYDAIPTLTKRECKKGASRNGICFAKFAEFLAAEGTEPLLSTTSGSGMDPALFQRIQTAFQRNGGVMQANADSTGILNTLGAEGATLDANTILLPENPSTSAVYEELIHTAQLRAGMTDTTEMEIQAAQKLIRFSDQYNIPASETQETINRLNNLLQQQGH